MTPDADGDAREGADAHGGVDTREGTDAHGDADAREGADTDGDVDARVGADAHGDVAAGSEASADHSSYWPRIRTLAAEADAERRSFDPPATPPDEERALSYLTEGAGRVVAVYVEARTRDEGVAFSGTEHALLHRALNDWLELYARCHGVELDADFAVREAAELLIETRDVRDTAQLLTRVPPR